MSYLNYHHLRYFRAIANSGTLTGAANSLGVSQSSLSVQLKNLEENLGQPLFNREKKSLVLTEAGRIALDYANSIFSSGEELVNILQNRPGSGKKLLRIGSVSTLSRNFQLACVQPFFNMENVELVLSSGSLRDLLTQLKAQTIDLVLSNLAIRRDAETSLHSHLLEQQPVSLVGHKPHTKKTFRFPQDLEKTPLILPTLDSNIRIAFDLLLESLHIQPIIAAEVDDMAMLRLLAREGAGLALVPPVVVTGELQRKQLVEYHRFTDIQENFYAITPSRRFPNPLVSDFLAAANKTFRNI